MLLKRLKEYEERCNSDADAETEEILPDEYTLQAVPWIVSLDRDGNNPHFIRTSGGGRKRDPGKSIPIPYLKRSGTNIKPQLLADKAELALGLAVKEDHERSAKRHRDFMALVEACAQSTGDVRVAAVSSFLSQLRLDSLALPPDLTGDDFMTFEVDDVRLVDLPVVQDFWAQIAPKLGQRGISELTVDQLLEWSKSEDTGLEGQCIVCGEQRVIARVHPVAIKLPYVVSQKQVALVTADSDNDAFHSYGLQQGYVSFTCRPCATNYARAINRLVRDERSHIILSGSVLIWWTRDNVDFDIRTFMRRPTTQKVDDLIEAVIKGQSMPSVDETAFYATLLSANISRVVVRDWIDTTIGNIKKHLAVWFKRQRIIGDDGKTLKPMSIDDLAETTVREAKNVLVSTPQALLHSALTGAPLPLRLLHQALVRNQAERTVTKARAVLLKLVLASNGLIEEDGMETINEEHPSVAYHCGRLLAVLDAIQREAIKNIETTIVDRFFAAASTTPSLVFDRLLGGSIPHLSKIKGENPAAYTALHERVELIMIKIRSDFPSRLTPHERALFGLGYFHQCAHNRAQMKAAVARKRENAPAQSDTGRN